MAGWQDFVEAIAIEADRKKKSFGQFTSSAANVAGDFAQSIARGAVNVGLTAKEANRNTGLDASNRRISEILNIDQSERERLVSKYNDPEQSKKMSKEERSRALVLDKAKRELGSLDDATLRQRQQSNDQKKKTHETYKATNPFVKAIIGGEDNEVAQSAQAPAAATQEFLKKRGATDKQAAAGGMVAGLGLTALDLPTGLGSVAKAPLKAIGKDGVKQLVGEGTEAGAREVLQKSVPNITEQALNDLAPQLALATDKKAVQSILKGYKGEVVGKTSAEAANLAPTTVPKDIIDFGIDTTKKIEQTAPTTVKSFGPASDKLLGNLKTSTEINATKTTVKSVKTAFKEQFVDKLSPINDMVKTIEQQTGKKLSTEDNPYELMRLYSGMPDAVQQRVRGLTDILKQAPDIDAVKVIGLGRQIRGRAERGVDSFISADDAKQAIQETYTRLGPQKFDEAAKVVDAVNDYNKGLLNDLHDSGIISDDAFKAIQEVGADYFSRFNVIDHIMKNDANRALFASSGSYNTTKQSLNKILASAKGMKEGSDILDPIESIVKSTDYTMRAIAKNNIWHAFDRLANDVPDLIVRTRDPENVIQRITLSLDNKELRPIRNKLDRMMTTRGKWVRQLESQVNQLEKKGLNLSLKKGGERMAADGFSVDGLGGKVPTSQTGKIGQNAQGVMDIVNPQKLGPSDTGSFIRSLIEKGSRSDIDKIKKMVGTRDAKLTQLLDDIGTMKSEFDDVAGKIRGNSAQIKELADTKAPDGMELISGFGKGVQGKLAVPKEIAEVFTGKTGAQQDYLTSMISKVNTFVKQNFTSNNPAFALITNPIRDTKTFAYNAKDVKANPLSIGNALAEGLWARTFGKGDLYERWVAAGGKSGFYADERAADQLAKDLAREVSGKKVLGVKVANATNTKEFLREAARVMTAPLRVTRDALHGAASVLEDTPRLAQFNASVKAGKTDAQAAFNARNVTVDFQQAGRIGQTVNAWIPFLNARFQGTLKSAEAIKNNPARAASVYAALTAAPILLAAANNEQYKEVMKMIPDQDRENNFIIVLGDAKDENGNFTQVLKIPKSDVDKILGNPLEHIARFVAKDDPQSLQEVLTNMVGNTLPVDVVKDSKPNLGRAVSGALPPLIKAPVEAVTNKNLYFGSDIVPQSMQDLPANEQVRDSTSLAGKFAGAITGTSPLVAENTVRNFTGSLLTKAPQDQLGGKLVGTSANKMNDEFYSILDKTSKNKASASKYINESIAKGDYNAAQQAAETYNAYLREQFTPFGKTYGSQMTQELANIYDEQKIVLTSRSIKLRQRNALERQAAGQ